jgi:hypothetical protein
MRALSPKTCYLRQGVSMVGGVERTLQYRRSFLRCRSSLRNTSKPRTARSRLIGRVGKLLPEARR